jgi:cobalt/nickel transport system permease protein
MDIAEHSAMPMFGIPPHSALSLCPEGAFFLKTAPAAILRQAGEDVRRLRLMAWSRSGSRDGARGRYLKLGRSMHIPDGFLDAKTALATGALSVGGLGLALADARRSLPPRKVPLLGLTAAFIFVAQMINFPVLGGTSGHLIGATLAAVLVGPSAAIIVIATVLLLQCFAFADGGVTALGANLLNMGMIGAVGGWMIYAPLARLAPSRRGRLAAAAAACWGSTVLAAVVCAGELAASGTAPWRTVFPAMAGVHALIGIGEAAITVMVLSAIGSVRPELLKPERESGASYWPVLGIGMVAVAGMAVFVLPFASKAPDGLEWTAERLGFRHVEAAVIHAPAADYQVPGMTNFAPAAAFVGMAAMLLVVMVVGRMVARGGSRGAGGGPSSGS